MSAATTITVRRLLRSRMARRSSILIGCVELEAFGLRSISRAQRAAEAARCGGKGHLLAWKQKMFAGSSRAIILIALAAFIGNAKRYGDCASNTCNSASSSKGCHHHKQPDRDLARCSHQHSEFTSAATGLSKITLAAASVVSLILDESTVTFSLEPLARWFLDTGPPVHSRPSPSVSVLRI